MFMYVVGIIGFSENKLNLHLLEWKSLKFFKNSNVNTFFRDTEIIPKESGKIVDSGCPQGG